MGKVYDAIDDRLRAFIEAQPVFFVATAPSGDGGHVNVSPKGGAGMFRVTGPLGFAYADMLGSGIETVAHLRDNGRICVMFAAFEGPPKIVRLHGMGSAVQRDEPGFEERIATFALEPYRRQAVRSVITVDVTRVSDSCGYAVPLMAFEGERDQLLRYADNRIRKEGQDSAWTYRLYRNAESLDGLPGLDPRPDGQPART
jgi:predicted pyridoxine 5'-phosphate oxidase superfamily flavin-nucleotide-binding protein